MGKRFTGFILGLVMIFSLSAIVNANPGGISGGVTINPNQPGANSASIVLDIDTLETE